MHRRASRNAWYVHKHSANTAVLVSPRPAQTLQGTSEVFSPSTCQSRADLLAPPACLPLIPVLGAGLGEELSRWVPAPVSLCCH